MNKKKIINDPIYGFVTIPSEIIYDLIEHRYYQRLRRISQLGLTHLVYPGALHTRFHHAIGALNLTNKAIEILRQKDIEITDDEATAVAIAILLHDVGHGPFSHALEHSLVPDLMHEEISTIIMDRLNKEFKGKLSLAIDIFNDKYPKKFLHQLISSQLDMDRLDYLGRDSFYTGVSEGIVGFERIINMLYVKNDELVVEEKGIYSIEKFIVARRLMYWQVYLHKTVIAAETTLINILKRAKEISEKGVELFATPNLSYFLQNKISKDEFRNGDESIERFTSLDDFDIMTSIKVWKDSDDKVLSLLCEMMTNRRLPKIVIQKESFTKETVKKHLLEVANKYGISEKEAEYFVYTGNVQNDAYKEDGDSINIYRKDGTVVDIAEASDNYNIRALENTVTKFYLCYPKL